jgi:integrase
VDERQQKKPTLTTAQVEQVISRAKGRYHVLFALLVGSGMRIGEALGLKIENISEDCSTLQIQQSVWRGKEQSPKTVNAIREIDLHSNMSAMLKSYIGQRSQGFVFQTKSGKPLTQRNVLRNGFDKIRKDLSLNQSGLGFHAFRRFRLSHLRKSRCPWDLEKFWMGHADKGIGDKYSGQLKEDVEWRNTEAERIGLGFSFAMKPLVGQLGQPEAKKSVTRKAA